MSVFLPVPYCFATGFCSCSASTAGLLLGLASPLWGPHRSCFSQVKSESWHHRCQGVCHFLSSVSLQQQFEAMDRQVLQFLDGPVLQLRVTAQFYLESKGKYILEVWRNAEPKDVKRRAALAQFWLFFFFFFMFFLLPLGMPYVNWTRQECWLSYLRSSLSSSDLPLLYFHGFSILCLLTTTILDSFLLF